MMKKPKYLGLFALLSLVTVALTIGYIEQVHAAKAPHVEIGNIVPKSGPVYKVTFEVHASDGEDLNSGKLLITSDLSSREVKFADVRAGSFTDASTQIKAQDPSSIKAQLILAPITDFSTGGDQIKESRDGPYPEVSAAIAKGDKTYDVLINVYAGDEHNLGEGKLLVSSDLTSKEANFGSVHTGSFTNIEVLMQADDPRSITAEFVR